MENPPISPNDIQPQPVAIEASPYHTGLQWLTELIFPSFLGGIIGRWLLAKLFDKLKGLGLLPPKFFKWLYRRMPPEDVMKNTQKHTHSIRACFARNSVQLGVTSAIERIPLTSPEDMEALGYLRRFFTGIPRLPTRVALASVEDAEIFEKVESTREAAGRLSGPLGGKKLPRGISEDGKPIWSEVISEYAPQITGLGGGDRFREWATAILIYQQTCFEQSISPWNPGVASLSPSPGEGESKRARLVKTLNLATKLGLAKARRICGSLRNDYGLNFPTKASVHTAKYIPGHDILWISAVYQTSLPPGSKERSNINSALLGKWGFVKGGGSSKKILLSGGKSGYLVDFWSEKGQTFLRLVIPITRANAFLLIQDRIQDIPELERRLQSVVKRWWRGGYEFK